MARVAKADKTDKGIVYIFTNPCLAGWIKIGCTEKDVQGRLKELNASTSIPLSFRIYATLQVANAKKIEQHIHKLLDIIDPSLHSIEKLENGRERVREFFQISPEKAYMIFVEIAALMGVSKDLSLGIPTAKEIEEEKIVKTPRKKTTFSNLQIPIGSELTFFKDSNIKCTVYDDDNKVLYNGNITSLSAIASKYFGRATQGPLYFVYNGETLWDRRLHMEEENIYDTNDAYDHENTQLDLD